MKRATRAWHKRQQLNSCFVGKLECSHNILSVSSTSAIPLTSYLGWCFRKSRIYHVTKQQFFRSTNFLHGVKTTNSGADVVSWRLPIVILDVVKQFISNLSLAAELATDRVTILLYIFYSYYSTLRYIYVYATFCFTPSS